MLWLCSGVALTHVCLTIQMLIRAHPFKNMPFHGKCRQDFVIWRTTYSDFDSDSFDLSNPVHEEQMGYGKVIMLFRCKVQVTQGMEAQTQNLVLLEELWRYTPPQRDYLADEYKCHLFYSTRPRPAYYVVDIDRILGPAALFRCPVNPSIGPLGLDRVGALNPSAVAERSEGDGKGSPLYRLHMWYMRWGNTNEGMKMVRRFAEKENE